MPHNIMPGLAMGFKPLPGAHGQGTAGKSLRHSGISSINEFPRAAHIRKYAYPSMRNRIPRRRFLYLMKAPPWRLAFRPPHELAWDRSGHIGQAAPAAWPIALPECWVQQVLENKVSPHHADAAPTRPMRSSTQFVIYRTKNTRMKKGQPACAGWPCSALPAPKGRVWLTRRRSRRPPASRHRR